MPIYMNWGNSLPPKIRGSVTEVGHVGWIELSSAQFGVGRSSTSSSSNSPRETKNKGNNGPVTELVVTKVNDASSASLYREVTSGEGTPVLIDFVTIDKGKPFVYTQLKLTGVLIGGYSQTAGGGRPGESLTLNCSNLEWGPAQGVTPHTTTPPQ